ncbi:MAG TPA: two-component regulator propeller domain-containing protein [Anaerolineae bacterium]|nr:two-component regulator propeller domain-containing protein [Anaerolineae bacterium]
MRRGIRSLLVFALTLAVTLLAAAWAAWTEPATVPSKPDSRLASEQPPPGESAPSPGLLGTGQRISPLPAFEGKDLKFKRISLEHGLSQSTVNCILQDSQGFMWFGTEDGLNKYDGYGFAVYRHDPDAPNSLSNDAVLTMHEDKANALWIGTQGGGLDRFEQETGRWRNFSNDPDSPDSYFMNWIVSIVEDEEGALWIGTYGGGLYQFDRETEQFTRVYDTIHPWILTVYADRTGALWIGSEGGGLYRLAPSTGSLSQYRHDPHDPSSLSADRVSSIYEDHLGMLWIGTILGGLNRFDRETESFVRYLPDPSDPHSLSYHIVASIREEPSGILWVGTGDGLDLLDRSTERFTHYRNDPTDSSSLSSNTVLSMYKDRDGALWIGTMGGGISRVEPSTEPFRHYRNDPRDANSLSNNVVRTIWESQTGALWLGTDDGLNRFDRETGQWRQFQEDPDNPHSLSRNGVRVVYEDRSAVLWVGVFGGGLNRFDGDSGFTHYLGEDNVAAIYEDREGVLWLGTQGQGLYQFDRQTESLLHYAQLTNMASDSVRVLHQDRSGTIWVGTDDGLHRLDRDTGAWHHYLHDPEDPHSLGRGWVGSIHEDQHGVLWIGTAGGGLNRFDPATETFVRYTRQDGLANDEVDGILEEVASPRSGGSHLWLSTNNGLSRFDPSTETFANYKTGGGLQSNKYLSGAYHQSASGEMFFGGVNGFVAFYPDRIQVNPHVPPIVLTSLTQDGRVVETGRAAEGLKEVTFRWPDNSFEFEFAALNYTQPEKNQYAYMLEGFDKDWIALGTGRSGRYTNLPGGTYTLRLTGSNNDGVWNEEGASLTVTVVPPLWQTWWFWGIVSLVLVTGAIGGYRVRVRSIEMRSRELERQVEGRTAELSKANLLLEQEMVERRRAEEALAQQAAEAAVVAERSRLARELHDAVTQTLFSASLIAETLPRSWERDREKGQRLLKELRQLSRGALAEMRTLLLELRPAVLVDADLGDLLRQLAEAASGQSGLPVTVTVEGECALPTEVHVAFYRVAQEALNNAVKHARAQQVLVHLRCTCSCSDKADERGSQAAELVVRDDGCGFDPDAVSPDRLGLGIMQERALGIDAVLSVESQAGQGTQVKIAWRDQG